jgi:hypothetical protein
MSIARTPARLELPQSLRDQLSGFRQRVWSVKTIEGAGAAAFGVSAAYLLMYGLDRVGDTPAWARLALFAAAAIGLSALPLQLYRWVWRRRRPEQLARLIARTLPGAGDQLLGVIELAGDASEQARSPDLVRAAIRQAADDASKRDLYGAVPNPRHKVWAGLAAVPMLAALVLMALYPLAASNAWARLLAPWKHVPRYTFAAVAPLPDRLVVPHGEPFTVEVPLVEGTAWRPEIGTATIGEHTAVEAPVRSGRYAFELPSQIERAPLIVRIGDVTLRTEVAPTLRPELTAIGADVTLPDYLERPGTQHKDVRGGAITLVKGSRARFTATASRELAAAEVDGRPSPPKGPTVASPETTVDDPHQIVFTWKDRLGLAGKGPLTLNVTGRDDEAPSLTIEGLPRQRVVLDTEQLQFRAAAHDDFGVRRVGIEWKGDEGSLAKSPAEGERLLSAGGPDQDALELVGTFVAKDLGIEPQPLQVRLFVEDYQPGRPRVYSPPYTFFVLNAEQHAVWLTEQLSKWHRQSMEVRDREMGLLERNKELRALPPEELDRPETRRRIEAQAGAERANGRRLSGLVVTGEDLVQQAMRNPEFGVGHLEKWAEMLQVLKDISGNRMPSVAELLDQAAKATAAAPASRPGPVAGQVRATGSGRPGESNPDADPPKTTAPSIVDVESSQNSPRPDKPPGDEAPPGQAGAPRLGLPQTTLIGQGGQDDAPPPPAAQKVDEAIARQMDLLAEFEKIADELNRILADLEGSTLVKRLKAASRAQSKVADKIGGILGIAFGRPGPRTAEALRSQGDLAELEAKESLGVSHIMDDMQSYYERRRMARFKAVLDEMRAQDVIGALRVLGDDLTKESGLSIAQCEFWSDTLDRWAEDLVDPASGGT